LPDPLIGIWLNEGVLMYFSVSARDIDNARTELTYEWFVDERSNMTGHPVFGWVPGFDASGMHKIRVEIGDGLESADAEWTVIVRDVNRQPIVDDIRPLSGSSAKQGTDIIFSANLSDPDGDAFWVKWKIDGKLFHFEDLGNRSSSFIARLGPGDHEIALEVRDFRGCVTLEYIYLEVSADDRLANSGPDIYWIAGAMAILVPVALTIFLRRSQNVQPR
jgi:hypothetical protein